MGENQPNQAPDRFICLLKQAMDEHPEKLSLNQVARRADLSPAYLSFLLNGKRKAPSREAIVRLAETLNISADKLISAAETPPAAVEFYRKEQAGPILRTLAKVPTNRLATVQKYLIRLVSAQKGTKRK